jgi:predicted RNA-binding Zn-ribbon protein involved in translation (DUF1610 family)
MKGGAMNKEGGLPKTEEELKNYYCPECGQNPDNPEQIVYEPNPHYFSPYVCTDCGKSVIPVSKDTGKQISIEEWKKERELLKGGSMGKGVISDGIKKIEDILAAKEEPEEKAEGGEAEGGEEEELVLETEEDVAELYEEAKEKAIELLDAVIEATIEEEGNPPKWVKNPAIWEKAKEAVEPYRDKYDEPYAVISWLYQRLGGKIK